VWTCYGLAETNYDLFASEVELELRRSNFRKTKKEEREKEVMDEETFHRRVDDIGGEVLDLDRLLGCRKSIDFPPG